MRQGNIIGQRIRLLHELRGGMRREFSRSSGKILL
jgi:hypothetical protein